MPFYTFENKKTKEEYTIELTMAEREEYIKNNPNIEQIITNVSYLYDHVGSTFKNDNEWKNLLGRIKDNNPGSTIDRGNLGET